MSGIDSWVWRSFYGPSQGVVASWCSVTFVHPPEDPLASALLGGGL